MLPAASSFSFAASSRPLLSAMRRRVLPCPLPGARQPPSLPLSPALAACPPSLPPAPPRLSRAFSTTPPASPPSSSDTPAAFASPSASSASSASSAPAPASSSSRGFAGRHRLILPPDLPRGMKKGGGSFDGGTALSAALEAAFYDKPSRQKRVAGKEMSGKDYSRLMVPKQRKKKTKHTGGQNVTY
ncbi:hypothetical protein BESB_024930 [Besnoitia besnoiti]|uniref:Uncharacterized protein n=1 Tax=Besnoitia besnoiti TaxID=94643 RepID=A0A2A9M7A5_BESBE|nr:uncharacterized protein BESB_024930 [Besnoitia besnoiti]PFH31527.1 hypothetical protein BESB_024930 [Besnoitia besnoiti]